MKDRVILDVMEDVFFTLRMIPWKFCVDISIRSKSGRGVKKGGTWKTVKFQTHGGQGHSWHHEWCFFTLRKVHWKFHVDILIRSVSGRGVKKGGYLEDIEGSWLETWRTGSFLTSWMMFFYPMEDTLKISCWYFNYNCVRKGGQKGEYLEDVEGSWPETWRIESFLMSWRMFFTLKKIPWKFRVDIFMGSVFV